MYIYRILKTKNQKILQRHVQYCTCVAIFWLQEKKRERAKDGKTITHTKTLVGTSGPHQALRAKDEQALYGTISSNNRMMMRSALVFFLVSALTKSPLAGAFTLSTPSSRPLTTRTTTMFLVGPPTTESTEEVTKDEKNNDTNDGNNDPKAKMTAVMRPIREAGVAGAVSLFLWEAAFWMLSVPLCAVGYHQTTGSWPDWSDAEDVAKVGAEAFAFANIARFALPVRVGLAVSTTPWVRDNLVDRFFPDKTNNDE